MAIGSLISGIFFFFFPIAVIAIILGHFSLSEIKKSAGHITGRGMAIAGLILGYLGIAFIPLLIIAAIAIPNLIRSKMAANEASAVGALKSYNYALATYASNCPNNGFPRSLENLGPRQGSVKDERCKHEGLLDNSLGIAQPVKSGYRFEYAPGLPNELGQITKFELFARPVRGGKTGVRYFFVDETAVVRVSPNSLVNEDSPTLQECCEQ
jgi:type IV pilus assembly protein PilA